MGEAGGPKVADAMIDAEKVIEMSVYFIEEKRQQNRWF
jgi:hypothetical protein